jgi:hypothetical protein
MVMDTASHFQWNISKRESLKCFFIADEIIDAEGPDMSKENPYTLSAVFSELVELLLTDDWECEQAIDGRKYYIFGWDAYFHEKTCQFSDESIAAEPRKMKWISLISSEKYLNSVMAGQSKRKYLEVAEKRLEEVGLDWRLADEIIALQLKSLSAKQRARNGGKSGDEDSGSGMEDVLSEDQLKAVYHWHDAKITAILESANLLDKITPGQLKEERQKLYLRELSFKYLSILKRLETLSPLSFADEQLNEATRCWLYGFYRATILLSASSLEEKLKKVIGDDWLKRYSNLIEKARNAEILDDANAEMAKRVFEWRNKVAHAHGNPGSNDARDVLAWVRGILTFLHENSEP